jgi:carboxypeptidase PM20D1
MTEHAIHRLRELVRMQTIAPRIDEAYVRQAFSKALDMLQNEFPSVVSAGVVQVDDPWSIVIRLPGSDDSLEPVLLLAHYDVVDVAPGTLEDWSHEPFGGEVDEGYVWGRGTLDDKSDLLAKLEAVESILRSGAELARSLVLAFGGDEEVTGRRGAARVAERFRSEGMRFHCALDEGSIISTDMLSNPREPVAIIGVAEKGYADIRIAATVEGGHSSMPPSRTALGLVADAVSRVQRHPLPARLIPTIREFFTSMGSHAHGPIRLVYRGVRLFWPLLRVVLTRRRETSALIRSTQALTMASGSDAPNVLPANAHATINVRILPGETTQSVLRHYERLLRRNRVTVSLLEGFANNPIPASSTDHPAYVAVRDAILETEPDCIVAPFLVVGSTDSKWYADLSETVLRFSPVKLSRSDLSRIHGTNERLGVDAYDKMIGFYERVIRRVCVDG